MDKAEAKTKNAAEKTKDATVKGAEKAGEKTKDVAGTTGEVINDAWITTKIKTKFVNEDTLKGSDINVDIEQSRRHAEGHGGVGRRARRAPKRSRRGPRASIASSNTLTIGPEK